MSERNDDGARGRVIEEKAELDERIRRLRAFLDGEAADSVSKDERARLLLQGQAMRMYSTVLGMRLRAWIGTNDNEATK